MRISFIGSGAIGSLFGGLLKKEGVDVLLIGRPHHVDHIQKNGLSISGIKKFTINIDTSTNPLDAEGSDLLVITTKAYDTKNALLELIPILTKNVKVMSLQNGVGNLEEISKYIEFNNIFGAVTSMGALIDAPGNVKFRGMGTTFIGGLSKENKYAKEITNIFNNSGIKTQFTNDIVCEIWKKAIINSAINTLASILDDKNGILLDENLLKIVQEVINEGKTILQNDGINIPDDIYEKTVEVINNTSNNINSTLSDLRNDKRTEIDYISGKIVEVGNRLGLRMPYNNTLMNMVKYKENKLLKP